MERQEILDAIAEIKRHVDSSGYVGPIAKPILVTLLAVIRGRPPEDKFLVTGVLALSMGKFDTEKTVETLLEKNRRYGDSALNPIRVASTAGPLEQIRVRIDDKLSRLHSGTLGDDEDPLFDLYGYCIIGLIAQKRGVEE